MDDYLDNPIWFGLLTGNSHLATGNNRVRYFPPLITTFAGLSDFHADSFKELGDIIPPGTIKASFAPVGTQVPKGWKMESTMRIDQMVFDNEKKIPLATDDKLVCLDNSHVGEMQSLTKLTNPGPFNSRTIEFGNYFGIFEADKLVAMAGQRLQPGNFSEISAVCTHPHQLGKGYARRLIIHQLNLISTAGKWPILHVKSGNDRPIRLYESIGFRFRRQFDVIVFRQEPI